MSQPTPEVARAVQFLGEVTDIEEFPVKIDQGGFLRTATRSHLIRLFNLSDREADEACDRFVCARQGRTYR